MKKIYQEEEASHLKIIRDYIAGMTDRYALKCFREITFPDELVFE